MERLNIVQLVDKDDFIKAHDHLMNCGWEIVGFGFYSALYKNKKDRLTIFGRGDQLLFKMNGEEAKELIESDFIKAISL